MKIVILHYHLKPGGVTTVIRQQVTALLGQCDTLVICGEKPPLPFSGKLAVVPGVGYDIPGKKIISPKQVAREINDAIYKTWPSGCDLIHVHNPLLAKNRCFLKTLSVLAKSNIPLFLQVHDFAEDGRPHALYHDRDYPENCHYGVINGKDYSIMKSAGLDPAGLHLIPNMVNPLTAAKGNKTDKKLVVYPVRAIRRKNIGEAILLSLFFDQDTNLAITLGPNSPIDFPIYECWKNFCTKNKLPVIFEASTRYGFDALVESCEAMLTTSISEGFGFSFLEPWTAGKGLVGRRLDLCSDFEEKGICLDSLYKRISIPLNWIDEPGFANKWKKSFKTAGEQRAVIFSIEEIKEAYESVTRDGTIDFSLLDESTQMTVIKKIMSDSRISARFSDLNPFIHEIMSIKDKRGIIAANRSAILKNFGQGTYAKRLKEIYSRVCSHAVKQKIDREKIARAFIRPAVFSLLKWGDYEIPCKL
ncbi:MAG: glycosyltransferase family 4 protein [Deltaproteobacteria bacterium]|nr:glycosyltransferase family 4 protein [Deltaproteobacteria bacterium]